MNVNQLTRGGKMFETSELSKAKPQKAPNSSEEAVQKEAPVKTDAFVQSAPQESTGFYTSAGTVQKSTTDESEADTSYTSTADQDLKELAAATVEAHNEIQADNMKKLISDMITGQNKATAAAMTNDPTFNVSEDGALGVGAVADNIMNLALTMAGDDPEMLEKMKEAVIAGFEAAGLEFDEEGNATGLPQVSLDTFEEVMKRFDYAAENGNSLDGYEYSAYDDSGRTATLTGSNSYSTLNSWNA
ncbi:MAG: hypothetical protein R3Y53_06300 [Bacillota bacterium]